MNGATSSGLEDEVNVVGALAGPLSAVFEFTEPGDRDTGARRLLLDPATGQPLGL